MIITISGNPGSGKSTVAKILIKKLNAKRIYVGGIRRELAREKGMTMEELNEYALTHSETDIIVDEKAAKDARALTGTVIAEGRVMFHFIPESIKIYVKVDPDVGAERIWKDLQKQELVDQRNEGKIESLEQLKQSVRQREENDSQRYKKYYDVDQRDEANYDFVVDSTIPTAEEVADKIIEFVESK
ncbi:AAA family ATPase [Candidatus Woesearchaeota archaeon]|jgi:cytidylate kinase|nr:AAA family ATPase [Candidatus Woesearchaeota archaeon]MBT4150670.1 AAA family ATPase [Candidatus Woesearchaeota archaeon]MBT4247888.1 AAA family ATPase [Candidatus Woesearchaeota archaeon]MBT4434312.1 AAA family ATPase [Candidatus Woesearchaeota archaeon]MBT7331756.1 AAA family ATPase [Candidatus Woesearchaeota archaeon]